MITHAGINQAATATQADGNSGLIGQYWTAPQDFHGRPSTTVDPNVGKLEPYAANNSSASNAGPTNAAYIQTVQQLINDHVQGRFLGIFGEPSVNVLDVNLALSALK